MWTWRKVTLAISVWFLTFVPALCWYIFRGGPKDARLFDAELFQSLLLAVSIGAVAICYSLIISRLNSAILKWMAICLPIACIFYLANFNRLIDYRLRMLGVLVAYIALDIVAYILVKRKLHTKHEHNTSN